MWSPFAEAAAPRRISSARRLAVSSLPRTCGRSNWSGRTWGSSGRVAVGSESTDWRAGRFAGQDTGVSRIGCSRSCGRSLVLNGTFGGWTFRFNPFKFVDNRSADDHGGGLAGLRGGVDEAVFRGLSDAGANRYHLGCAAAEAILGKPSAGVFVFEGVCCLGEQPDRAQNERVRIGEEQRLIVSVPAAGVLDDGRREDR